MGTRRLTEMLVKVREGEGQEGMFVRIVEWWGGK